MGAGDITTIEAIRWDWFVSCTVAQRGATDVFLKRKAFALFRYIARRQHIRFSDLPWVYRIESGSDPDHRHFHFLVGSLTHKSQTERFQLMARWNILLGGSPDRIKGTCRARLYDPACGLAGYLAKELNGSEVRSWVNGMVTLGNAAARIAFRNAHVRVPLTASTPR